MTNTPSVRILRYSRFTSAVFFGFAMSSEIQTAPRAGQLENRVILHKVIICDLCNQNSGVRSRNSVGAGLKPALWEPMSDIKTLPTPLKPEAGRAQEHSSIRAPFSIPSKTHPVPDFTRAGLKPAPTPKFTIYGLMEYRIAGYTRGEFESCALERF
jgi:hypothetical protein